MKAVICEGTGGPEVLRLLEVAEPQPEPGQVVIEVRATAVNRADLLQRRGLYPPPPGESDILGLECAGTVLERGAHARRFALGARVMALLASGGYAERVAVDEGLLLPIPERLAFEGAAAVPEAYLTATEALIGEAALRRGEIVLVTAAASGVGSAAVQIAKLQQARVIGSSSAGKLEFVRSLGAEVALDREDPQYVEAVREASGGRGADVLLDFVGASAMERHQACLATGARHVVIGLLGGARAALDLSRLLARRQRLLGLVMRTRSLEEKRAIVRRFMTELWPALEAGALSPQVDSVVPIAQVAEAHRRMEENANRGKIVLSMPKAR